MALYVVIADDLTGASDTALPFVGRQEDQSATIGVGKWPAAERGIVAISTETRERPPAESRASVQHTFQEAIQRNPDVLLKKIDSQLRGGVGAELETARTAINAPFIALAPALPRIGRTVTDGQLRVPPGRETQPSENPDSRPAKRQDEWHEIRVAESLATSSDLKVTVLAADDDPATLASALAEAGRSADVVSYDSTSAVHIETFLRAALTLKPRPLLAGTAALATALVTLIDSGFFPNSPEPGNHPGYFETGIRAPTGQHRNVLYVLGSRHAALSRQIEVLMSERGLESLALTRFRAGHRGPSNGSLILESVLGGVESPDRGETARELGRAAWTLHRISPFDAVVCSGGAVAAAVAAEFGITSLTVLAEITEGFALTSPGPDSLFSGQFALRPGSYGADNDLVIAHDLLTKEPQ